MKHICLLGILVLLSAAVAGAQTPGFAKLDGSRFELGSQRDKVVVLALGARWLPFSKGQAATLNRLSAKFSENDAVFFFVMTDGQEATNAQMEEFARANKLTAQILRDPRGAAVEKLFSPEQMPAYIVIGRDGKMIGNPLTGFDLKADLTATISEMVEKAVGN